ncbi:MAG TPA: serine/threonine-protein kinase, partial [Pirellulaceae bacterium]|nr:serine/threonine-protein kinase [Pirellulaceae bacterium]
HDADEAGSLHFLVMEFVDGINLAKQVEKTGPLPIRHACHFARQVALGLEHAHERGMVHRDIKPQNLMLTRQGRVKILDFGLARFASEADADSESAKLTKEGVTLGTPDYIAPEQVLDSRKADIRADVYSLGCTLYFMLAGKPPFSVGTAIDKMKAH